MTCWAHVGVTRRRVRRLHVKFSLCKHWRPQQTVMPQLCSVLCPSRLEIAARLLQDLERRRHKSVTRGGSRLELEDCWCPLLI